MVLPPSAKDSKIVTKSVYIYLKEKPKVILLEIRKPNQIPQMPISYKLHQVQFLDCRNNVLDGYTQMTRNPKEKSKRHRQLDLTMISQPFKENLNMCSMHIN